MDKIKIEQNIRSLVMAADARDADRVSALLANDFRVVLHDFPEEGKTTVLDKSTYLGMMREGKIGGEKRQVHIESVQESGNIASAKVILESEVKYFHSYYHLIRMGDNWLFMHDMPKLIKK